MSITNSNLVSEDVVFLVSGRPPMDKSEFVAGLTGLEFFHLHMTGDVQEVEVFGDLGLLLESAFYFYDA